MNEVAFLRGELERAKAERSNWKEAANAAAEKLEWATEDLVKQCNLKDAEIARHVRVVIDLKNSLFHNARELDQAQHWRDQWKKEAKAASENASLLSRGLAAAMRDIELLAKERDWYRDELRKLEELAGCEPRAYKPEASS